MVRSSIGLDDVIETLPCSARGVYEGIIYQICGNRADFGRMVSEFGLWKSSNMISQPL